MAALQGSYRSYPAPPGDKRIGVALLNGPASYAQFLSAVPSTGGFLVNASDLGLVEIEFPIGQIVSDNGQFVGYLFPASAAEEAPQKQMRMLILNSTFGQQVAAGTNLSARTFLVVAIGN